MKNIKKSQYILIIILAIVAMIAIFYLVIYMNGLLLGKEVVSYHLLFVIKEVIIDVKMRNLFFCLFIATMLGVFYIVFANTKDYKSNQIIVTPNIAIPVAAGQGQCGTAKWLDKKQYDLVFGHEELELSDPICSMLLKHNLEDIQEELQIQQGESKE